MAEGQEDSDKTEEPTQKRVSDAVKKGQVSNSREITNFLMFVALAMNIAWFAPYYMRTAVISLSKFIQAPHEFSLDLGNLTDVTAETMVNMGGVMLLPIIATVFVAIFSSFIQNGFVISSEPIIPKFEKISILKGVKRLFSMRSFIEFIKGIIKLSIVGGACFIAVSGDLYRLENIASYGMIGIIDLLSTMAFHIVIAACSVMAIIAVLDFMYQKFEYLKSLKMTRQELKEEFKQSEGDPQIKAKLRQIRMERAQKRMMSAVPEADVVIRNPEHFAIALKYDEKVMAAPVVIAMGQDNIAMKIIDVAEEHDIPLVRNPPLARALYASCEIDSEIPLQHYHAVAEVIGYVYKLKGRKT